MFIHEIQPKTQKEQSRRVGRGGKRGKTSGRGHKGQKARAGNSVRPYIREIIKKLPKLRGYGKNRARTINSSKVADSIVTLSDIESVAKKGDTITPQTLVSYGLVEKVGGQHPSVKILSNGDITKAVTVIGCSISKSATSKIEKAGGKVLSK